MITIYTNACVTCGVNSIFTRRVQAYARSIGQEVQILNSKYDANAREVHADHLLNLFGKVSDYTPIVVTENGNVVELRKWNS